jgi:predicted secreted protein
MALSTLFPLMDKEKFEKRDDMDFTKEVTDFTKEMIRAWGENEITHCMVGFMFKTSMCIMFKTFYCVIL